MRRIEIDFPIEVELTEAQRHALFKVLDSVCEDHVCRNPSRVMWVFGHGHKMLVNPLALSDDEPNPFDESTLHIEIAEREA